MASTARHAVNAQSAPPAGKLGSIAKFAADIGRGDPARRAAPSLGSQTTQFQHWVRVGGSNENGQDQERDSEVHCLRHDTDHAPTSSLLASIRNTVERSTPMRFAAWTAVRLPERICSR